MDDIDRPKPKILIAEDRAVNQKVIALMLKKLGHEADIVSNGLEVLQALEKQPYDIIYMDIQMPKMDGFDTARVIRQRYFNGIKIIAVTGYIYDSDRKKCIESGMDDCITKPISIEKLKESINNYVPRKHSADIFIEQI
jgi:CheY-like chemotaxis protein